MSGNRCFSNLSDHQTVVRGVGTQLLCMCHAMHAMKTPKALTDFTAPPWGPHGAPENCTTAQQITPCCKSLHGFRANSRLHGYSQDDCINNPLHTLSTQCHSRPQSCNPPQLTLHVTSCTCRRGRRLLRLPAPSPAPPKPPSSPPSSSKPSSPSSSSSSS
jgi:hypothetical protein